MVSVRTFRPGIGVFCCCGWSNGMQVYVLYCYEVGSHEPLPAPVSVCVDDTVCVLYIYVGLCQCELLCTCMGVWAKHNCGFCMAIGL